MIGWLFFDLFGTFEKSQMDTEMPYKPQNVSRLTLGLQQLKLYVFKQV